ncbi:MAG: hypothetical protein JXX29_23660 [Deltaproteobacteria bacterium]|nr:hypothetical protein [Deltaproteobacteria bacterium]MBN2674698.1 hypothetical protein [Deltaproteobacteria bacterium]
MHRTFYLSIGFTYLFLSFITACTEGDTTDAFTPPSGDADSDADTDECSSGDTQPDETA